jgi:hypothetical protein
VQMDLTYPNGVEDRRHFVFPIINRVQVVRAGQEPFQFMQWVTRAVFPIQSGHQN